MLAIALLCFMVTWLYAYTLYPWYGSSWYDLFLRKRSNGALSFSHGSVLDILFLLFSTRGHPGTNSSEFIKQPH